MELNSQQIQEILPHRYPFLLIDKVLEFQTGKFAKTVKCVTRNEEFFNGHFPNHPVMPGVLILEAMAQTGAVAILSAEEYKGKIALFGGVKKARFKKQVVPGDTLVMECTIETVRMGVGMGSCTASVDGTVVATAQITFSIK